MPGFYAVCRLMSYYREEPPVFAEFSCLRIREQQSSYFSGLFSCFSLHTMALIPALYLPLTHFPQLPPPGWLFYSHLLLWQPFPCCKLPSHTEISCFRHGGMAGLTGRRMVPQAPTTCTPPQLLISHRCSFLIFTKLPHQTLYTLTPNLFFSTFRTTSPLTSPGRAE